MITNYNQFGRIIGQNRQKIMAVRHDAGKRCYLDSLALFDIKGITDHGAYGHSKFGEGIYHECIDSIEKLFVPRKNSKLKKLLKAPLLEGDAFFEFPRGSIALNTGVGIWIYLII